LRSQFKPQYNFTQSLYVFYTIDIETCCQINDITLTNYVNGNLFLLLLCLTQTGEERKKQKRDFQTQNTSLWPGIPLISESMQLKTPQLCSQLLQANQAKLSDLDGRGEM
jgi:hypothetical protein